MYNPYIEVFSTNLQRFLILHIHFLLPFFVKKKEGINKLAIKDENDGGMDVNDDRFFSFHAILSNLPSYDDCDVNAGVTLQMTLVALGVNVVEKCEQQFFQFLHSHTHTNTQSLTAEYVRRGRAGKKFTDQPIRQRRSSSQSIYCNFMI